jgi:hypothetical protein
LNPQPPGTPLPGACQLRHTLECAFITFELIPENYGNRFLRNVESHLQLVCLPFPVRPQPSCTTFISSMIYKTQVKVTVKFKVTLPYNRPRRPKESVEVQPYSFLNLGARWGWVVNARPRPDIVQYVWQ